MFYKNIIYNFNSDPDLIFEGFEQYIEPAYEVLD